MPNNAPEVTFMSEKKKMIEDFWTLIAQVDEKQVQARSIGKLFSLPDVLKELIQSIYFIYYIIFIFKWSSIVFSINFCAFLAFECGIESQAKGSCLLKYGDTRISCAVSTHKRTKVLKNSALQLRCRVKFAETEEDQPESVYSEEKIATLVEQALLPMLKHEEMPPWPINLHITVLNNDGCVISTAITCASLALLDAEVPSHGVMVASTSSFFGHKIVINPYCKWSQLVI